MRGWRSILHREMRRSQYSIFSQGGQEITEKSVFFTGRSGVQGEDESSLQAAKEITEQTRLLIGRLATGPSRDRGAIEGTGQDLV